MRTVTATLFDPENNFTADFSTTYGDDHSNSNILYHWLEGNFSCDCNRRIFLYGYDDYDCGDTVVLKSLRVDDEEIYW